MPATYAYVVVEAEDQLYAGFEAQGVWSAPRAESPWRVTKLDRVVPYST